jgi:hypothetical protein
MRCRSLIVRITFFLDPHAFFSNFTSLSRQRGAVAVIRVLCRALPFVSPYLFITLVSLSLQPLRGPFFRFRNLMMIFQTLILLGLVPFALAKVQFLGVAIAGGDFGCQIDGTCPTSSVQFASDAADQMKHFVSDGMNLMRIRT